LALTSRDMSCHSELQKKANITFLKQTSEKDGENVDVKLYRITRHSSLELLAGEKKVFPDEKLAKKKLRIESYDRPIMPPKSKKKYP
jgi:hypothetical protein